ncbi:isoprenoid synthase domain-containing protein [Boletus reticuloceps]|uniref:Terpene synthase n=1 Tax=Boletus reticuloceps TaxID=495285 RepID=A0A8I2YL26_9AGAM|nr:isoprenoid synthase domain-containing protein [Boletus reticuloceps]
MDTLAFLSLSALIALLIRFAFSNAPGLVARRCKGITSESILREEMLLRQSVNKSETPTRIFIPNVFARWPWPRRINPNYAVVKEEADAWMTSFKAFSPKAQDVYNRCDSSKSFSLQVRHSEHVRSACDLMHLFFMFDEYSDRSTPSEVCKQKEVIMDALRNPHTPRPEGEWIGGEMARQFWQRAIQNATVVAQKRVVLYMDEYFEAVVQESIDKENNRILDVESYIIARRRTSGVKPSITVVELGLDIPDEVMSHPALQEMIQAAVDMIAFSNDIYSYNLERLRGDDFHNIITCVMKEYQTDVNGAMLWTEGFLLKAEEGSVWPWRPFPNGKSH